VTELAEHRLTVELERTGEKTDKVQSYRLTSNYLTPCDEFEFVVYDDRDPASLRRKWMPLSRVKLYIDGEQQLLGRIDETEGVGDSSSALMVRGRDYMAELVDGGADPSIIFKEGMDLGDALLLLFRPFGIDGLVGNYNLTRNLLTGKVPHVGDPLRTFKEAKLRDFKVQENMGTHEVADKICARHGFMLRPTGFRNIVAVVEPLFGQEPLYRLTKPGNVKSGHARRSYAEAPSVTIATNWSGITGQQLTGIRGVFPSFGPLAPNELGTFAEVQRITQQALGAFRDTRVNWKKPNIKVEDDVLYRPMFYKDKDSRTTGQVERGIRRELARRLKDCLVYSCELRGHREVASGAVYAIDTMAQVRDETEDVDERMWVLERTFQNTGSGPTTQLKLVLPGAIAL
jgi:hypothetical protein